VWKGLTYPWCSEQSVPHIRNNDKRYHHSLKHEQLQPLQHNSQNIISMNSRNDGDKRRTSNNINNRNCPSVTRAEPTTTTASTTTTGTTTTVHDNTQHVLAQHQEKTQHEPPQQQL
jgi:hypothetical protein